MGEVAKKAPEKLQRLLEDTWSVHEAFRRLGIGPEKIFVLPNAGPEHDHIFVRAIHGDRSFDYDVGKRRVPTSEFARAWSGYATAISARHIDEAKLQKVYNRWASTTDAAGMIIAMKVKLGVDFRSLREARGEN